MKHLKWGMALLAFTVLPLAAQSPRPLTLGEAIGRGWSNGVNAMLARLAAKGADARVGESRAALLPDVSAMASVERQTVNLSEFGISIPGFPAVTDPFTLFRGRAQFSQLLYDASTLEHLRMRAGQRGDGRDSTPGTSANCRRHSPARRGCSWPAPRPPSTPARTTR